MQWRADASCLGADPELFTERPSHKPADWADIQQVISRYCSGCRVVAQCRADGDANKHVGVWGGRYRHHQQSRYHVNTFVEVDTRQPRLPIRAAS